MGRNGGKGEKTLGVEEPVNGEQWGRAGKRLTVSGKYLKEKIRFH